MKSAVEVLLLYSHMQIHAEYIIKTSDTVLLKNIPLTLFERLRVRESWRPNKDCNILTPTLMAISVVSFSLSRGSGGQPLWVLASSTTDLQLTDILSPPSYIIVQSPTQSLEWHV